MLANIYIERVRIWGCHYAALTFDIYIFFFKVRLSQSQRTLQENADELCAMT